MNTREAAQRYIDQGWYPVPLKKGTKEFRDKRGLDKTYLADEFGEDDNIGIRTVSSKDSNRSEKVVAVDFDAHEITKDAVWAFFPKTCGWGRASKELSQLLYSCSIDSMTAIKDLISKSVILELRVDHQSMAPPSTHPNGEAIEWLDPLDLTATVITPEELRRYANLLATYVMLARYYPPERARHFWGLYVAGLLKNLRVTVDECLLMMRMAGTHAKDKEIRDRLSAIASTFAKDDDISGVSGIEEQMGTERGSLFVKTLRKIWGGVSGFVVSDRGDKVRSDNQVNSLKALAKMGILLSKDGFANQVLISNGLGPPKVMTDITFTSLWLEIENKFQFRPPKDLFFDIVAVEAHKNEFHPVRDYLKGLRWDGTKRVDTWLIDHAGVFDNEYSRAVSAIVLIAAVRRVRQPGCKYDELLVLEGGQGWGKSTSLRNLCPKDSWFSDDLPLGIDAKQMIERTGGKWIIEIQELIGGKRETEHLKASLSRQGDGPVRLAYARMPDSVPRQFIMIGSTNAGSYLKDSTGNRRFWPLKIGKILDPDDITKVRDQLWAEAATREEAGEEIRLAKKLWGYAGQEQESRRVGHPWEDEIGKFLDQMETQGGGKVRITKDHLWKVLGVPVERRTERDAETIAKIMEARGYVRMVVKDRDMKKSVRGWGRGFVSEVMKEIIHGTSK